MALRWWSLSLPRFLLQFCLAEDFPSDSLQDFSSGCAGWAEDWRPSVYQLRGNSIAGRDRTIWDCETVQRPGHPGSLQCRLGLMPARHVPVTCVLATPWCRADGEYQCGLAVNTMRTLCDGRREHQCGLAPLDTQFGGGFSAGALSHPGLFACAARAHSYNHWTAPRDAQQSHLRNRCGMPAVCRETGARRYCMSTCVYLRMRTCHWQVLLWLRHKK